MTEQPNTGRTGVPTREQIARALWASTMGKEAAADEDPDPVYWDEADAVLALFSQPRPEHTIEDYEQAAEDGYWGALRAAVDDPTTAGSRAWASAVRAVLDLAGVPVADPPERMTREEIRDAEEWAGRVTAWVQEAGGIQPPPPEPQRRIWVRLTDEGARGRKAWSSGQQVYVHEWTDYGPRVTDPEAVTVDTVVLLPGEYVSGASAADPEPQRPEWVRLLVDHDDGAGTAGKVVKADRFVNGNEGRATAIVTINGTTVYVPDGEWEPADPPPPEPEPMPFALGDEVRWQDSSGAEFEGVIESVSSFGPPILYSIRDRDGHESWGYETDLERVAADPPVVPAPQDELLNVGDNVTCDDGHGVIRMVDPTDPQVPYWVDFGGHCEWIDADAVAPDAAASPTVLVELPRPLVDWLAIAFGDGSINAFSEAERNDAADRLATAAVRDDLAEKEDQP